MLLPPQNNPSEIKVARIALFVFLKPKVKTARVVDFIFCKILVKNCLTIFNFLKENNLNYSASNHYNKTAEYLLLLAGFYFNNYII